MKGTKEVVTIPDSATGVEADDLRIWYWNGKGKNKRKSTWNRKKFHLSCPRKTKSGKALGVKLDEIQGKKPKKTVKYGTKDKNLKALLKATEEANELIATEQEKNIISRKQMTDSFRVADSKTKAEILADFIKIAKESL
jgi:hypothetical protein